MLLRCILPGVGLVSFALAGVLQQSQSESLDEDVVVDHPDVQNPTAEDWQRLKNISNHKHNSTSKGAKNLIPESREHPKHHNHPASHKAHDDSHNNAYSAVVLDKRNEESNDLGLHNRGEQPQDKLSKSGPSIHSSAAKAKPSAPAAPHKVPSSKVGPASPKSHTVAEGHKSSTSRIKSPTHASAAAPKSSAHTGGHKTSTIRPGFAAKGKGKDPLLSGQTSKGNLNMDPSFLGPQSKDFMKGPYGPMFDINNVGTEGRTGDQNDPVQETLWYQQGFTKNRGVPIGSKLHLQTKRDEQICSAGEDSSNECQTSDNLDSITSGSPSVKTDGSDNPPARHSLWSRFNSLVKRVTIGAQSIVTGSLPQHDKPPAFEQVMVFNGQPGMIWLKEKGDITYCSTDDNHNIIGDSKVYVPSIYYTDTHNRNRCNQPCYLFWMTSGGSVVAGRFDQGKANMQRVLIAGQCNDCWPWEVQAEGAVIDIVAGNQSVDWNRGLWGPTLTLGTNEDY